MILGRPCLRLSVVGSDLFWRHGAEDIFRALPFEAIVIGATIVNNTTVKLPWASQEKVTNRQGHHITLHFVLIGVDLEIYFHGVLNLDGAIVEAIGPCTTEGDACT